MIIIIKIIHSTTIHQRREALLQITNIMLLLLLLYVYRVSELSLYMVPAAQEDLNKIT